MVLYSTKVSDLAKPVTSAKEGSKKVQKRKASVEDVVDTPVDAPAVPDPDAPKPKKPKTEAQLERLAKAREARRIKKEEADKLRAQTIVDAEKAMIDNQKKAQDKKEATKEKRRLAKEKRDAAKPPTPQEAQPPKPAKEVGPPKWFLDHEEKKARVDAGNSDEKKLVREVKAESKQAATTLWNSNMVVGRGPPRGEASIYRQMFNR